MKRAAIAAVLVCAALLAAWDIVNRFGGVL